MTGRDKIVSADDAVEVVLSGDTVVTGGFVGIGFPEYLASRWNDGSWTTGAPRTSTLVFAAARATGARGLNHFAHRAWCAGSSGGTGGRAGLGVLALDDGSRRTACRRA